MKRVLKKTIAVIIATTARTGQWTGTIITTMLSTSNTCDILVAERVWTGKRYACGYLCDIAYSRAWKAIVDHHEAATAKIRISEFTAIHPIVQVQFHLSICAHRACPARRVLP